VTSSHRALTRRDGAAAVERLVLVVVTWGCAVVVALGVAASTRVGPVVVRLTGEHGVHFGDLVAGIVCITVALVLTSEIIRRR
jgi:hypothetical protein